MPTLYCQYCGSVNLSVYKVVSGKTYYKCGECGRIVVTPIVIPDSVAVTANEAAE